MKNPIVVVLGFTVVLVAATAHGEQNAALKSGLQPGEAVSSFYVYDASGPAKGTSICYACRYGNRPVVNLFVREVNDKVVSLARQLDRRLEEHQNQQLRGFLVLLSLDPDSDRERLARIAEQHGLKHLPLTVFDGLTGPPKMKIDQHADVTVMLWNEAEVKSNHAFTLDAFDEGAVTVVINDIPDLLK